MTTKTEKKEISKIKQTLEKVVVNVGVGRLSQQGGFEDKILPQVQDDIAAITGQKPQVTRARKSIAGFKTREGQIVGLRVTLRDAKMVDFFERLIRIVLPRVHDFRGLDPKNVDQGGALNIGLKEQFVFPELNPEESPVTFPLGINIVSKTKNREEAHKMYVELGVPFMAETESKKAKKTKRNG